MSRLGQLTLLSVVLNAFLDPRMAHPVATEPHKVIQYSWGQSIWHAVRRTVPTMDSYCANPGVASGEQLSSFHHIGVKRLSGGWPDPKIGRLGEQFGV